MIALVGHLNTRRQTKVSVATVQQQVEVERARLEAEAEKTAAERQELHRRSRIEAYRAYLDVTFEFMAMAQGVEPLTPETWRDWRQRDSASSSALELVCSDAVYEAVDRFDEACVALCRGNLTEDTWDVAAFKTAYRNSDNFIPAYEAVVKAMRLETAPR